MQVNSYICEHCNKEPLFLTKGCCPTCGGQVTKIPKKEKNQ